jgi:hypothetical protein
MHHHRLARTGTDTLGFSLYPLYKFPLPFLDTRHKAAFLEIPHTLSGCKIPQRARFKSRLSFCCPAALVLFYFNCLTDDLLRPRRRMNRTSLITNFSTDDEQSLDLTSSETSFFFEKADQAIRGYSVLRVPGASLLTHSRSTTHLVAETKADLECDSRSRHWLSTDQGPLPHGLDAEPLGGRWGMKRDRESSLSTNK